MTTATPSQDDSFSIPLSDLKQILKNNKRKIFITSCLFALLTFLYRISLPVEYQAEATFKEKGKSQSGINISMLSQLRLLDSPESDAITIMKSRTLVEALIKNNGLQAKITPRRLAFPFFSFENLKNNFLIEYALLRNAREPVINDPKVHFNISDVAYNDEIPRRYTLKVDSPDSFAIYDTAGNPQGNGTFGQPFSTDFFSITIANPEKTTPQVGQEYNLELAPLSTTAKDLSKKIKIDYQKNEKGVLKITHDNPSRHQAAKTIVALMDAYQDYTNNEHERICCIQVDYLTKRQREAGNLLANAMQSYAKELSSDLSSSGFANSEKAIDYLAENQNDIKRKLFAIELDIQRLEHMNKADETNYEKFTSINTPPAINRLMEEMSSLKNESDAFNVAIRNSTPDSQTFEATFAAQVIELDNVKKSVQDAKEMLASLDENKLPQPISRLINNPKFIVKMWYERAQSCYPNSKKQNGDVNEEWKKCKENFSAYLSHLIHYLSVYQRNIEGRLAYQQAPLAEFQGLNLATAKELYILYSKELSDTEAQAIQRKFIIGQIHDPDFEVTSLSTVLNDPISTEMISKAGEIILSIKDYENRSPKEQERLKADLAIQKGFLTTHLEQSLQLLELRQNFLKEKMLSLQNINLSLLQEQISLLENQIKKYISNALENLYHEKGLLEKNLMELRLEMAAFPQKWAAQQLIIQHMEINKAMVEEITKLVESKNIANNLEKIQSAPLDLPVIPIHPKPPRLVIFTILGGLLGAFLSSAWLIAQAISKGIEPTEANMRLAGFHVSGSISTGLHNATDQNSLLDSDLNTLRRIMAFINSPKDSLAIASHPFEKVLLIMRNSGPNYSAFLAELLFKKGLKVLCIDFSAENFNEMQISSLTQYLEGKISTPTIHHNKTFDSIDGLGLNRFANEFLTSHRFTEFVAEQTKPYDWVLITTKVEPQTAEAESLLDLFPNAVISLIGGAYHQLHNCMQFARKANSRITFVFTQSLNQWNRFIKK